MGIFKTTINNDGLKIVVEKDTDVFVEMMKAEVQVTFFCVNYFYVGKITAVNGDDIVLEGARIVYETGSFTDNTFKFAQSINGAQWFIRKPAIESYGVLNKS